MHGEEAVEVEPTVGLAGLGHGDAGTAVVVLGISHWRDQAEPVGTAPQEQHNERVAQGGVVGVGECQAGTGTAENHPGPRGGRPPEESTTAKRWQD